MPYHFNVPSSRQIQPLKSITVLTNVAETAQETRVLSNRSSSVQLSQRRREPQVETATTTFTPRAAYYFPAEQA